MAATTYNHFPTRLEATPHGAVHCGVGSAGCGTGLMGSVPSAALDPIFYFHHVNIDRLYECWQEVNPQRRLPTGNAIFNRSYSFVDGDGTVRQRRVRDMLTTASLAMATTKAAAAPRPRRSPWLQPREGRRP